MPITTFQVPWNIRSRSWSNPSADYHLMIQLEYTRLGEGPSRKRYNKIHVPSRTFLVRSFTIESFYVCIFPGPIREYKRAGYRPVSSWSTHKQKVACTKTLHLCPRPRNQIRALDRSTPTRRTDPEPFLKLEEHISSRTHDSYTRHLDRITNYPRGWKRSTSLSIIYLEREPMRNDRRPIRPEAPGRYTPLIDTIYSPTG